MHPHDAGDDGLSGQVQHPGAGRIGDAKSRADHTRNLAIDDIDPLVFARRGTGTVDDSYVLEDEHRRIFGDVGFQRRRGLRRQGARGNDEHGTQA